MKYEILPGQISDAEAIAQFQVNMAFESEGTNLNADIVTAGVKAAMADENKGRYFVAKCDGLLVGSLLLTREWSDWNNEWYWWIQSVYVLPEHRQHGVYSALYSAVKDEAKRLHIPQVRLYVDKTNLRAQNVYSKLGMHESHYLLYEEEL